jgi:signal transduction histidine kinase
VKALDIGEDLSYYQRRIESLNDDLIAASAVASRLHALQAAFFEVSQANEVQDIYETVARAVLRISGGTRALIRRADGTVFESGEESSLAEGRFRPSISLPIHLISGSATDLNAPLFVGSKNYFWGPLASIGSIQGYLYVDGIEAVPDGLAIQIESLTRFAGVSLESLATTKALAESNFFKDDLLFMFTHDFRSPLTTILGYGDMLKADQNPDAVTTGGIAGEIIEAAERLQKMAEDALSLVKSQSAGFSLARETFDFVTFVRESIESTPGRGERVRYEVLDEKIMVNGDRNRLRQVIDNLIGNALKYSRGEVTVRVSLRDVYARVTVEDRGIGIPEEEIPKIFSRMSRASNAKGFRGHGVGLYIANKIVQAHGGRITVSSIIGQGSSFDVLLPL